MAKLLYTLSPEYLPGMRTPENQQVEVEFKATVLERMPVVSITRISFTPLQLPFLSWQPKLFSEIYAACKAKFIEQLQLGIATWESDFAHLKK